MKTIANIEFNKIPLSEGIMIVSQSIRIDFPLMQVQARLDSLVEAAKAVIDLQADNESKINQLITLFIINGNLVVLTASMHYPTCFG